MKLPDNYYHCFLGNGLDAVLIGPTGSMVPEKVGVDRCVWYKSDRYYPEDKIVRVSGRWPLDQPLEHAEGSGWCEIAPLGRTWYHVFYQGRRLALLGSQQKFVPHEGTLYTQADYGYAKADVITFMHPTLSLLVEHYTFDQEVEVEAWIAPGVWLEEDWDSDPFISVTMRDDQPEGSYDLGETRGLLALRVDLQPAALRCYGLNRGLRFRARTFTKYFAIIDSRQGTLDWQEIDHAIGRGYDSLRAEHLAFWRDYFAVSSISIPDAQFQYFHDATMYHLKAMQNPVSGGLPVNNLRRTWSSHIFWDAYFMQRALLEANHTHEALESCRFFQRTEAAARRHASEEFGCEGLKWDWEITHDGRKAYGALLHQKFQIHNNGSHANQIWGYYEYTQDKSMLREFFPILEGLAKFYLNCIVERAEDGFGVGYQVGVHEHAEKVRNDGINVAGTIAILRHAANAARILGIESDFTRECAATADELVKTIGRLYNGSYFRASENEDHLNMSSIAPVYPMWIIDPLDERAISTAKAYIDRYEGRLMGHGGSESGFPWSAGVMGAILALQEQGDTAWQIIETARPTICTFGGMTEVMQDNKWNMQYFGTAQGAVCTALHYLVLQARGDTIHLFPAIPASWQDAGFTTYRAAGWLVSATYHQGEVECAVRNAASESLTRTVRFRDHVEAVTLAPGMERTLRFD